MMSFGGIGKKATNQLLSHGLLTDLASKRAPELWAGARLALHDHDCSQSQSAWQSILNADQKSFKVLCSAKQIGWELAILHRS